MDQLARDASHWRSTPGPDYDDAFLTLNALQVDKEQMEKILGYVESGKQAGVFNE